MKRKFLYGIFGGVILATIGMFIGMVAGFNIGGNYFIEFEFLGGRGYEAVGYLCAIFGAAIGMLLGAIVGIRLANSSKK